MLHATTCHWIIFPFPSHETCIIPGSPSAKHHTAAVNVETDTSGNLGEILNQIYNFTVLVEH